jgi:hypothetical protein
VRNRDSANFEIWLWRNDEVVGAEGLSLEEQVKFKEKFKKLPI